MLPNGSSPGRRSDYFPFACDRDLSEMSLGVSKAIRYPEIFGENY